jgi:molybdopterin-guanine dinucleotide biosynthesis protein A
MNMDAIVTAGGIPQPGEPLYESTQGKSKALLDVAGKPMIQWVLDALCAAQTVGHVVIVGLPEDNGLTCSKIGGYLPNQGGMLSNIKAGIKKVIELNSNAHHVLLVSSDIPTMTGEMVDWVVNTTMQTDEDVYYNVISRQTMEKRFPGSKRTYTRFKDIELCGGDMNVIRTSLSTNEDFWEKVIAARKNALKQASLLGFDTLILLLFHAVTLDGAIKRVTKRVKLTGRAIVCPYAEIGMDVDKPNQLEMVRADLVKQRAE